MTVISMAAAKHRRNQTDRAKYEGALSAQHGPPEWQNDIRHCCAYARLLNAEHAVERERVNFDLLRDHKDTAWWNAPAEIQARVEENNRSWNLYIALLRHIASLPAQTRGEAQNKRYTIGKMWLRPDGTSGAFENMRDGCLADDHLFPPSLKLARLKGAVRVT